MPKPTSDCRATERKHPWPMVRLGDVCEFSRGLTYSKSDEVQFSLNVVLRSNNVDLETGRLVLDELKYIRDSIEIPTSKRVAKGAILMCTANGSKQHLGKVALIDGDYNCAFGGFMGLLTPNASIDSRYLYWQLMSFEFKRLVTTLTDGANINNLKFADISQFTFLLPPLTEQKEIVARLERELAAVEKMKKGFEALAETAKAEFKAELKEVFEALRCSGVEMKRLGEVGRVAMCKRVLKAQTSDNGDIPFFKIGTFGKEPNAYISNELFGEFVKKFSYPKKGDVLISAAGTIGRTIVFDGKPSYFQDSNIVWLEHDGTKVTNEYLHCFYWSKPWKVSDGATIPRIYNGDIESAEIPLPSLPVQRQIVDRLSAAKVRTEKLEAKAREGVAVCETMRKAILKEAFE